MKFPTRYPLFFCERATLALVVAFSLFGVAAANAQMRDSDRGDDRGGGMRGVGTGIGIGIGVGIIQGIINNPQNSQGQTTDDHKTPKKPDKKTTAKTPPKEPPPKTPAAPPPPTTTTGGPPTTTDKPPTTTTTDKPPVTTDNPPTTTTTSGGTPPNNPGGTVPPPPQDPHDVDVPHNYGRNVPNECPQRGMGCAALVIDFNTHTAGDMTPFVDHLGGGACDIEFVSTDFLSGDDLAKANRELNKNNGPDDKFKNVNNIEMDRVKAAIARHRARVSRGAETAIEIIRGEGYPAEIRTCGSVGPSDGASLDRQEFVDGNYEAANKHVCGWVMADFSCHSGYTPQAFDEINNGAPQYPASNKNGLTQQMNACTGQQSDNCAQHAGYDYDIAMGQSTSTRSACALFTPALRKSLIGQLAKKNGAVTFDQDWHHVGFGSYYSDQGYRYCNPVVREGYTSEKGPTPSGQPVTVAPVTAGSTTAK
jgi:hypothetical protein